LMVLVISSLHCCVSMRIGRSKCKDSASEGLKNRVLIYKHL
jgi:hypothetical protein